MKTLLQQVNELLPLYYYKDSALIGLKSDLTVPVKDTLVVEINLKGGTIKNGPWSLQKKLKFGFYYPIENHEVNKFQKLITACLNATMISEIIDLLLNPEPDAVESLIWLPDRLVN